MAKFSRKIFKTNPSGVTYMHFPPGYIEGKEQRVSPEYQEYVKKWALGLSCNFKRHKNAPEQWMTLHRWIELDDLHRAALRASMENKKAGEILCQELDQQCSKIPADTLEKGKSGQLPGPIQPTNPRPKSIPSLDTGRRNAPDMGNQYRTRPNMKLQHCKAGTQNLNQNWPERTRCDYGQIPQ